MSTYIVSMYFELILSTYYLSGIANTILVYDSGIY